MYSFFDTAHWLKVKKARREAGLNCSSSAAQPVLHTLTGMKVLHLTTEKVFTVESVKEDWYKGRFYSAVLNCDGSHRVCFVENINCHDESVLAQIDAFKTEFAVMN